MTFSLHQGGVVMSSQVKHTHSHQDTPLSPYTIVQNKIISVICSCVFFCLANIYWPRLGKVQLGRPNSKPIQLLNFYLRRKRKNPFYPELYTLQCAEHRFSFIF